MTNDWAEVYKQEVEHVHARRKPHPDMQSQESRRPRVERETSASGGLADYTRYTDGLLNSSHPVTLVRGGARVSRQ